MKRIRLFFMILFSVGVITIVLIQNINLNTIPVAINDTITVFEDASMVIDVLKNDTDKDGDTLSIFRFTQGSHGLVTKTQNNLRYTPNQNFNGLDSFTYEIIDGKGGSALATVSITITSLNDRPIAYNDDAFLNEDDSVIIHVLDNDTDIDGDTLTILRFTQGLKGRVFLVGNTLRYTPNANFNGSDYFTYTNQDEFGGSATSTVSITVHPVNDQPLAINDSVSLNEDDHLLIPVLANDTDIDNDTLTLTEFTQGTNGSVTQVENQLRYTPNLNFNGSDQFTYTISDGQGGFSTATVTIGVNLVNDHPIANNDSVTINEDEMILIDVLLNDSDIDENPLTIIDFTEGANGSVILEGNQLRYTPNVNFNGSDSFTYTISDGFGGSSTATVTITVNPVNDTPQANNDSETVNEDSTVLIDVLINDTDIDGDTLTITAFTQCANGTITQVGDSLRYTPNVDFNGSDSFTYEISDGLEGMISATVYMTINPINDAPIANNDLVFLDEDSTILIDVLANDLDIDGDSLSITGFIPSPNGTVVQEDNQLRYTPNANYNGTDGIMYEISDGLGGTAIAMVSITVNSVNDLPLAYSDNATVDEDSTILIDVIENDFDMEGDPLIIVYCFIENNGTISIFENKILFTPNLNFYGEVSIRYGISDDSHHSSDAMVYITVNPVNDTPLTNNDSVSVNEDSTVLVDVLENDTDIDGDTLTIIDFTQGENGTVTQEGDSLRYTPNVDFNGSDSFTYEISDGLGGMTSATVYITISPINDAPTALDDTVSLNQDSTALINVLENDTDIDGDTLSITDYTQGLNGTVTQEEGSLRYTPNLGYYGNDSFTYTISDGLGGLAVSTVNVTINQTTLLDMDIYCDTGTFTTPVEVATSGVYMIETSFYHTAYDTILLVYDSNMNLIASNDDYTDLYAALFLNLNPGTYYIKVENFDYPNEFYCHLDMYIIN